MEAWVYYSWIDEVTCRGDCGKKMRFPRFGVGGTIGFLCVDCRERIRHKARLARRKQGRFA